MFGRFFHLMVDAVLISVALSGIKRSTGLTPAVRRVPNKDVRNLLRVYLETGEWVSEKRQRIRFPLPFWTMGSDQEGHFQHLDVLCGGLTLHFPCHLWASR